MTAHLIALGILTILACRHHVPNTLLLVPQQPLSHIIDAEQLEMKNGEDYFITYEVHQTETICVLNQNHEVTLKGTNYLYPVVMKRQMVSGAFFSKAAQESNQQMVVLNKWAAFQLYGSYDITGQELTIDGALFTVAGVMDDKDKKALNLYLPQCFINSDITSLAASFEISDSTPNATVENALKPYGITSNLFQFYNMNEIFESFTTKLRLSSALTCLMLVILCAMKLIRWLRHNVKCMKRVSQRLDFKDFLRHCRLRIARSFLGLAAMLTLVGILIMILTSLLHHVLALQSLNSVIVSEYASGLPSMTDSLNRLSGYMQNVFASFLVLFAVDAALIVIQNLFSEEKTSIY